MTLANRTNDGPQQAVPRDHPLMIAWEEWRQSDQYANTLKWAGESNVGNLWAAFSAGFQGGTEVVEKL